MAATSGTDLGRWPKWLLAILVGGPVAIGLGYYYYKKKNDLELECDTDRNGTVKATVKDLAVIKDEAVSKKPVVPETPLGRAQSLRASGNDLYKKEKYPDAMKCYSEAISICPEDQKELMSMLYQNRAATQDLMQNTLGVVKDCSKAIELKPGYLKALNRRYKALEKLGNLKNCIEDLTAICILEGFENLETLKHADRVLRKYGNELAKELYSGRLPSMPSKQFIKAYFGSFANDPVMNSLSQHMSGGDTLVSGMGAAKRAMLEERYEDVVQACTEQLALDAEAANNTCAEHYEALLMRASIFILRSETQRALQDFNTIIEERPADVKVTVNALVKRAALNLQLEEINKCMDDFQLAYELDPTNSDVYHHRGQVYLLSEKLDLALADFERAVEYSPNFGLAVVQKFYTMYRCASHQQDPVRATNAAAQLSVAAHKYNTTFQGHLLLGQVYADQKEFKKAENAFNKAMEKDPQNATVLVHKGLLELQWHNNVDSAVASLERAIVVDNKCEFAFETLASIEVQRGNLVRAVELFEKALALAKSEKELSHICALKVAAEAQQVVARRLNLPNNISINF